MIQQLVKTPLKSYPVYVGPGAINVLPDFLTNHLNKLTKILVITDENVGNLYLSKVVGSLNEYRVETDCTKRGSSKNV